MSPHAHAGGMWPRRRSSSGWPTASETPVEAAHILLGAIGVFIAIGLGIMSLAAGVPLLAAASGVVICLIAVDVFRAAHRRSKGAGG
ncbi:hypothetical protein [Thermoactinospora rubra]|uniref:hypothetical protein n=1 Tax=Thermoactinospora rubra TaxID=1088767 RepID=UPI0011803759|nr:hypothetical protein [Thermoactinospora rubra]